MGVYRVAEVCLNGHVTTDSADTQPQHRQKYCSTCGETTTTSCPNCSASIRGDYHVEAVAIIGHTYTPPFYCHNCGNPFPWTQRRIASAIELVEIDKHLSSAEIEQFRTDVTELTRSGPRTVVATARFKNTLSKIGISAATGLREILIDVLSDAAKKAIWGG